MKSILVAAMAVGTAIGAPLTPSSSVSEDVRKLAAGLQEAQPEEGQRQVRELEKHGEAGVRELVSMLREDNDAQTVQASFALEALTMHVSRPGAEADCRRFASVLARQLENGCADDVSRAVLVKALQLCGGDAEVPALAGQLARPQVRGAAIMALTAIGTPRARQALVDAAKAAPAAVAQEYVSAFATLRETGAADLLVSLLSESTPYQAVAILSALGELGHGGSAEALLTALRAEAPVVRAAAAGALAKLVSRLPERAAATAQAQRYFEQEHSEAAMAVLVEAQGLEASMDVLMQEIAEGNLVRREAALALIGQRESASLPARLLECGAQARPAVLSAIVTLLGRRGEAAAREFVLAQLTHREASVRSAAIMALPGFGVSAAVKDLVKALVDGVAEDVPVIRQTLAWQQAEEMLTVLAEAVPQAKGAAKVALLELLAARGAREHSAVVLAALADDEAQVRRAALKALEVVASPADADAVLAFMLAERTVAERRGAMTVLAVLGRADAAVVSLLATRLAEVEVGGRVLLLQTLSRTGGEAALAAVVAHLEDEDGSVRSAAVRALSAWPDSSACEQLYQFVEKTTQATHRVLALRGLIRLLERGTEAPQAERVAAWQRAAALCRTDDEHRLVLGALGQMRGDEVLTALIMPAFAKPELVSEASVAAIKVICPRDRRDSGLKTPTARKTLDLVLARSGNAALREQALRHLATFPPEGIDVAFGRPVQTSCPQQGAKAPQLAVDGILTRESAWFGNQWPSWFRVDLEERQTIDSIRPIFYWDGRRSYAYTVEVSDDGVNWRVVVDMSKNTRPATEYGENHVLAPAVTARYVRLNILRNSANEAVHLVELEVYSRQGRVAPARGPNLLLRQPVTAGSPQEEHYAPTRVNDGRLGKLDGWHTDQCPTWIKVDMQRVAEIDTARVIFYWDGRRTYSYNIEVSEDEQSWVRVADNANNQLPVTAQGIVHRFPKIKARYMRLNVTRGVGGRYVHVVELEAYAAGQAPKTFPAAEAPLATPPPLPPADKDGFIPLFNGKSLVGWHGNVQGYSVLPDGILRCEAGRGGKLLAPWQFADFELRFEFRLTPGANNGLAVRAPLDGDPAYAGMELQIIDNDGYKAQGKSLQAWQHHGSIYGVVPASDAALRQAGEWNEQIVVVKGTQVKVTLNGKVILDADTATVAETADGKGRQAHPGLERRIGYLGWLGHGDQVDFRQIRLKVLEPGGADEVPNVPPAGYKALFNGRNLIGWKGLVGNPLLRAKMTDQQLVVAQAAADADMRAHWSVKDGILCFDGKGSALCTDKDYGNFELLVDWKITSRGDSGIYLRGAPQVQIWDPAQWRVGSGGLYNNQKHPSKPAFTMDNPVGYWNRFKIRMVGERVSVWLNGALIVDNVVMENYWDRRQPIFPRGQIELQNHNSPLWFRNIFIRELE